MLSSTNPLSPDEDEHRNPDGIISAALRNIRGNTPVLYHNVDPPSEVPTSPDSGEEFRTGILGSELNKKKLSWQKSSPLQKSTTSEEEFNTGILGKALAEESHRANKATENERRQLPTPDFRRFYTSVRPTVTPSVSFDFEEPAEKFNIIALKQEQVRLQNLIREKPELTLLYYCEKSDWVNARMILESNSPVDVNASDAVSVQTIIYFCLVQVYSVDVGD